MAFPLPINDILPWTQAIVTAPLGQTVFSTTWTADYVTDIVVYVTPPNTAPNDVAQIVAPSNYTVQFIGTDDIVQVTFNVAVSQNYIVTIIRNTPSDRLNYFSNTNFLPTMLNNEFGRLVLMIQQNQMYNLDFAPHYNISATPTDPARAIDLYLPILPASTTWAKNPTNTAIIAVPVSQNPVGTLFNFTASNIIPVTDVSTSVNNIQQSNLTIVSNTISSLSGDLELTSSSGAIKIGGVNWPTTPGTTGELLYLVSPTQIGYENFLGTFASVTLNNLTTTAINAPLLSAADNTLDLGAFNNRWANVYTGTLRTGETNGNTLLLQGFNTTGSTWTSFITLTAGATATAAINGAVTSVTQAPGNNTTLIATTAFVTAAIAAAISASYPITLAQGGTGAALTASNGGIFYSNASTGAILAGTATALQMLQSGSNAAPTWSTATWPATTTINQLLYSSSANVVAGLATANSSILVTSAGGVPSLGTALPNGITATTQTAADNSTKVATTAYVDAAVSGGTDANVHLSNLSAVAVNLSLTPGVNNTIDLGTGLLCWRELFASSISSGSTSGNTLIISGRNVGGASDTPFFTITSDTTTPTAVIASAVTATTQSAGDNSTKIATTAYADRMVPLAGGTMTGALILNANPVTALGAVTKQYVDAISAGLDIKTPCRVGTTAALTVTYSNGAAGVGATLTNAGTQLALAIDSITLNVNDRVLVKNQVSTFQNGIYSVTNVGSGATNWVMTRTADYNLAPSQIFPGNFIIVDVGTTNTNTAWIQTATVTTIGTDAISFSQFAASVSFPITLAQGGTNANLTANVGGIVYSTSTAMAILNGTATANQMLQSGSSAAPAWSTSTWPATITINQLLYSSSANVVAGLATANSSILVTSAGGIPSLGTALPSGITATTQTALDNSTKVATTAYVDAAVAVLGNPVALSKGGTNANLTANVGGIFYSTASAGAILSGTATANQMLQSGASAAPAWSTTTWPATTTINRLLWSSAANVISDLATGNSGLLVTSAGGVPSIGTAIPNGVTATTQAANDNSTKVATTAYVNAATSAGSTSIGKLYPIIVGTFSQ